MRRISENIYEAKIKGVFIIERPVFEDNRGFFHEIARLRELKEVTGVDFKPIQFNHSRSLPRVIRAIHAEDWNKLVYPVSGKMFAALVDLREESKTFAMVEEFVFDCTRIAKRAIFIPKGVGNSLCVIGKRPVDYIYLVDEEWSDEKARGVLWNDPDLRINWPIKNPIISERDKNNPRLRELFPHKFKNK